jgi:hypothetical protein
VHQLGLYKTALYFRSKDAMIQDFMFEILIYFNSPISEHLTPMNRTPHVFPLPLWNSAIFVALESLSRGLQMFDELQK